MYEAASRRDGWMMSNSIYTNHHHHIFSHSTLMLAALNHWIHLSPSVEQHHKKSLKLFSRYFTSVETNVTLLSSA